MQQFEKDGVIQVTTNLKEELQSREKQCICDAIMRDQICGFDVLYPYHMKIMDVHDSHAYCFGLKQTDGNQTLGLLVLLWDEVSEVGIYCGSHVKGFPGAERLRFGFRLKTEELEQEKFTETKSKMKKGDV